MPREATNNRNRWTPEEISELRQLASEHTPSREICLRLGRSIASVRAQAFKSNISLGEKKIGTQSKI